MKNLESFKKELRVYSSLERAKINAWFFKTGKGEYGEGDLFLGITVPNVRRVVSKFLQEITDEDIIELLNSPYHEDRLSACLFFSELSKRARKNNDEKTEKRLYMLYIKHAKKINNWDLVDTSAPYVVGEYLYTKDKNILYKLANSNILWERRIAIISTFAFIKKGEYKDTVAIAEILLTSKEDLLHKAVGWMLREVGKRGGMDVLNTFLDRYASTMPRTMLRYSLEHHDEISRKKYMNMK